MSTGDMNAVAVRSSNWICEPGREPRSCGRIRRSGGLVRSIEKPVKQLFCTEGNRPQTKQIRASARIAFGILVP